MRDAGITLKVHGLIRINWSHDQGLVIWCKSCDNWTVLDVGESSDVKNRVLSHDRKPDWVRKCQGLIYLQ